MTDVWDTRELDLLERLDQRTHQLERMHAVLEQARVGMWEYEVASGQVTWDRTMYLLYGLVPDSVEPTFELAMSFVHPDDIDEIVLRMQPTEPILRSEYRIVLPDGTTRRIRSVSAVEVNATGDLWRMSGVLTDITLDHEDRQQLASAAELTSSVLDTLRDRLLVVDRSGDTVVANSKWLAMLAELGASPESQPMEVLGSLVDPGTMAEATAHIAELFDGRRQEASFEFSGGPEEDRRIYLASLRPIVRSSELIFVMVSDITARRAQETESLHSRKLEAVGQLAAGIAHEINTPIQFIGDNLRFLEQSCPQLLDLLETYRKVATEGATSDETLEMLRDLEETADLDFLRMEIPKATAESLEGTERVAGIVRAMKSFGHPGDPQQQSPTDLNEVLQNALVVARNEIKHVATCELDLADLPLVKCFVGDINQVALNLLINAAQAMTDRSTPGVLTVSTSVVGDEVAFRVSDTGSGMTPEVRQRIFEPFFTTKSVGTGTGQGLAITHSIVVERHGGSITVDSEPGVGTTFEVRLPIEGRAETNGAVGTPGPR